MTLSVCPKRFGGRRAGKWFLLLSDRRVFAFVCLLDACQKSAWDLQLTGAAKRKILRTCDTSGTAHHAGLRQRDPKDLRCLHLRAIPYLFGVTGQNPFDLRFDSEDRRNPSTRIGTSWTGRSNTRITSPDRAGIGSKSDIGGGGRPTRRNGVNRAIANEDVQYANDPNRIRTGTHQAS